MARFRRQGRILANARSAAAKANVAAGQAQAVLAQASHTVSHADGLIDELFDGITLKLVKVGEASIMDFLTGKVDELPLAVRIEVEEEA